MPPTAPSHNILSSRHVFHPQLLSLPASESRFKNVALCNGLLHILNEYSIPVLNLNASAFCHHCTELSTVLKSGVVGPGHTTPFGTNKKLQCVQKAGHKSPESQPEARSVIRGRANWRKFPRHGLKNTGLAKSHAKLHSVFRGQAWTRAKWPSAE